MIACVIPDSAGVMVCDNARFWAFMLDTPLYILYWGNIVV